MHPLLFLLPQLHWAVVQREHPGASSPPATQTWAVRWTPGPKSPSAPKPPGRGPPGTRGNSPPTPPGPSHPDMGRALDPGPKSPRGPSAPKQPSTVGQGEAMHPLLFLLPQLHWGVVPREHPGASSPPATTGTRQQPANRGLILFIYSLYTSRE